MIGLRRFVAFTEHDEHEHSDRRKREQAEDDDNGFHGPKLAFGRADGNSLVTGGFVRGPNNTACLRSRTVAAYDCGVSSNSAYGCASPRRLKPAGTVLPRALNTFLTRRRRLFINASVLVQTIVGA